MDAEIIRNLLKCNLTDEECRPIYLEGEDLAEGIVQCEASVFAKNVCSGYIYAVSGMGSLPKMWLSNLAFEGCEVVELRKDKMGRKALGKTVSQFTGADPRKDLAFDLWIKAPSEKSWILFKLEEDLEPSTDVKALGEGPSKFKLSDEVTIRGGERDSPTYPPGFGPLSIGSDQHEDKRCGDGTFLGYSKGAITLNENSRNISNFGKSSPFSNDKMKAGIDDLFLNEDVNNGIIIRKAVTGESIPKSKLIDCNQHRLNQPINSNQLGEEALIPAL
ncbi:hypothetical protein LIER_42660 [Lithospermum erythrorhizon]|uniref:Uncharacterized protein n=1 Tax=Lithospermum erythrorhizon TaxID=34254 RepID=A0AAV3NQF5_LITER